MNQLSLNLKHLNIKPLKRLNMAKKPVWIEGPHILKEDGWYYLICAEGGTGYDHSEVVFRGKSPEGPFVSYEKNPILTQRQLDPNKKDPINPV